MYLLIIFIHLFNHFSSYSLSFHLFIHSLIDSMYLLTLDNFSYLFQYFSYFSIFLKFWFIHLFIYRLSVCWPSNVCNCPNGGFGFQKWGFFQITPISIIIPIVNKFFIPPLTLPFIKVQLGSDILRRRSWALVYAKG